MHNKVHACIAVLHLKVLEYISFITHAGLMHVKYTKKAYMTDGAAHIL